MHLEPDYVGFLYVLAIVGLAIFALVRIARLVRPNVSTPVPPPPATEPTLAFQAADPAVIPVVISLLNDAGIQFFTSAENTQDLIGGGRLGGQNLVTGPVQFFVRKQDLAAAHEVLDSVASEYLAGPSQDQDGA